MSIVLNADIWFTSVLRSFWAVICEILHFVRFLKLGVIFNLAPVWPLNHIIKKPLFYRCYPNKFLVLYKKPHNDIIFHSQDIVKRKISLHIIFLLKANRPSISFRTPCFYPIWPGGWFSPLLDYVKQLLNSSSYAP